MIELKHISKSYLQGNHTTNPLRDINISIQTGEFVALTGTSGSGKTTCMNILGLIDKPTGGHYYLDGMDVSLLSSNEAAYFRNRFFGFIFQLFFLLPHLNVLQNTCLPLRYRKLNRDDIEQQAFESLKQVGLKEFATHKPHQLSGGQQQRVAIARALVGQPKIILADEPTGSLDTKTGQVIMDLLLEINKTHHTTVIIVTHDPHIARQCSKVIEIIDGQLKD